MSKKLSLAIIGSGRVAGHHAKSICKNPNLNLVAVCDLNPERGEPMAQMYNTLYYNDYFEMLAKHPEIEVVAVITPSGMHFEHAMDVIKNFKRHVVIEKPMVMTLKQGDELRSAAREAGVEVFPVFQYRFNQSVQRVRRAVEQTEIGKIFMGTIRTRWCRPQRYYDRDAWRGKWALDGGALTNQGIHHLDLLRYIAGDVKRVHAVMKTFGVNVEVEDTLIASIEFESGALGVIEVTTAARPDDFESSISVLGDKGIAMIGGWATNELRMFSPDPAEQDKHTEQFPDVYGFGHEKIYEGVYNKLVHQGAPAVQFEDAMGTMRLLHALYASAETGEWVTVNEGRESKNLGRPDEALADLYRTHKVLNTRKRPTVNPKSAKL